jgi:hypothetical protein
MMQDRTSSFHGTLNPSNPFKRRMQLALNVWYYPRLAFGVHPSLQTKCQPRIIPHIQRQLHTPLEGI